MTEIANFSISQSNLPYLFAKISDLDLSLGYVVTAKIKKSTRSTDQNSRLWKLYTALGQHVGHSPDEVHQLCGFKFLRELKTINGLSVEIIKSTTKLNTADMATYQEQIEQWSSQIGFFFDRDIT
jgi:hypothetical protein